MADLVVDGGDRSCGELLLVLHRQIRGLPAGAVVELVAHDPIAPIDLPVWCHLTGHHYLGTVPGQPEHFLIEISADPAHVRADRPWHLEPVPAHAERPHDSSRQ